MWRSNLQYTPSLFATISMVSLNFKILVKVYLALDCWIVDDTGDNLMKMQHVWCICRCWMFNLNFIYDHFTHLHDNADEICIDSPGAIPGQSKGMLIISNLSTIHLP